MIVVICRDEKSNIEFSSPKSSRSAKGKSSPHSTASSQDVTLFQKRAPGQAYSIESEASEVSIMGGAAAGGSNLRSSGRPAAAAANRDSDDEDEHATGDAGDESDAPESSRRGGEPNRRRIAGGNSPALSEQPLNEIGGVSSERVEGMVRKTVTAIALCHNVTPVIEEDGNRLLQAASPDEVALVKFSDSVGLKLEERTINQIVLNFVPTGTRETYTILNIFPFTSETKRMGIIVQHATTVCALLSLFGPIFVI